MTHEQYGAPRAADDGVSYESESPEERDGDVTLSNAMELLSPLLCDVSEVQIRSGHHKDMEIGRVKDSDDPRYNERIVSGIDDYLDQYPLFS